MKKYALAMVGALAFGLPAAAQDYEAAMKTFVDSHILAWASDPTLIAAVRAQNEKTGGLSQAEIDALDQAWRAEVGTGSTPTISPVINNAASDFLRKQVEESAGAITELFIMDARGLNVAASDITSDYWQGDEEKYSMTYPKGVGAIHYGEIELDESSQTYQGQVSITLVDSATQEVVGAMTIGLNAEALF